jgi:glutamine cyclotransferase
MTREIKNNIYRVNYHTGGVYFIESETKQDLFKYLYEQENKGYIITGVNLIQPNGKTPKIAFRTDKDYKKLKNK